MKKTTASKKYATGGTSNSDYRPVQGPPKPKPLTPAGSKKPVGAPYAKPAAKPTPKTPAKPAPKKPASSSYGPRTKEVIKYMNPSNIKPTASKTTTKTPAKTPAKPATKPAATKPAAPKPAAAKTVSQTWAEKTGTSWAEAKKLGLTDGSAKANMALMAKLNKGTIDKSTIATMKDNSKVATLSAKDTTVTKSNATAAPAKSETKSDAKPSSAQMSGSGMGAMERMEGMYKRGGSVKKAKAKKK